MRKIGEVCMPSPSKPPRHIRLDNNHWRQKFAIAYFCKIIPLSKAYIWLTSFVYIDHYIPFPKGRLHEWHCAVSGATITDRGKYHCVSIHRNLWNLLCSMNSILQILPFSVQSTKVDKVRSLSKSKQKFVGRHATWAASADVTSHL